MSYRLEGYEQYEQRDWDGYGSEPITPETLRIGRILAELFSGQPDVAPGGDGSIGFEWVNEAGKVFLDIKLNNIRFYVRIGDKIMVERVLEATVIK